MDHNMLVRKATIDNEGVEFFGVYGKSEKATVFINTKKQPPVLVLAKEINLEDPDTYVEDQNFPLAIYIYTAYPSAHIFKFPLDEKQNFYNVYTKLRGLRE